MTYLFKVRISGSFERPSWPTFRPALHPGRRPSAPRGGKRGVGKIGKGTQQTEKSLYVGEYYEPPRMIPLDKRKCAAVEERGDQHRGKNSQLPHNSYRGSSLTVIYCFSIKADITNVFEVRSDDARATRIRAVRHPQHAPWTFLRSRCSHLVGEMCTSCTSRKLDLRVDRWLPIQFLARAL